MSTLNVPLDNGTTALEAVVERTDDAYGSVDLRIPLPPGELVGRLAPRDPVPAFLDLPAVDPNAGGAELERQRCAYFEALAERRASQLDKANAYIERLEAELERVRSRGHVDVTLEAEQARALAAALWHVADRSEAR
jgi:hypothetical protein